MDIFGPHFGPIPDQSKLANFGSIFLCDTANMGFFGWEIHFWHFGITLGTFCIRIRAQKWLNFGPIPAQAKLANFGPIYLQFTAN